jgi:hypothetical protein
MGRTIIVGDVHGCAAELDALLDRLAFCSSDRLVFVGDLVARGPDSRRVITIARRAGATVVRGNHEEKLLRWRAAKLAHLRGHGERPEPLKHAHAKVVRTLLPADWAFLAQTPLYLDLPDHGARVVHAGVLPGIPFAEQKRQCLMRIRGVGSRGEWIEKGPSIPWGQIYSGAPHVLFGHNAMLEPQLHEWATGLDTACVYGGRLTAMVLRAGERVPRGREARHVLASQRAFKAYFEKKGNAWLHDERSRVA